MVTSFTRKICELRLPHGPSAVIIARSVFGWFAPTEPPIATTYTWLVVVVQL